MKKILFGLAIGALVVSSSCTKPEPPTAVLPSNIVTSISTESLEAQVTVSAENANFYDVTFYENGDSTRIESPQGLCVYSYAEAGVFTIRSRAYTSYYDFIEKWDSLEVIADSTISNSGAPTTGYVTPTNYPGKTLVWSDEFDGNSLSSDWVHEIGNDPGGLPGWGNGELQYYQPQNTEIIDGVLKITAKQENVAGFSYSSSRIKTQGIQSFKYGRIDIRAALPKSQGLWPALWMLGDNIGSVGWPSCGEIDIMELIGGGATGDKTVYGTAHWDDAGTHASFGGNVSLPTGDFSDEFHVFSIIWDANGISWLMDDVPFVSLSTTDPGLSEFQENFFFIFNIAVGGNWPGNPDASSMFPQSMYVDYVRVFQ